MSLAAPLPPGPSAFAATNSHGGCPEPSDRMPLPGYRRGTGAAHARQHKSKRKTTDLNNSSHGEGMENAGRSGGPERKRQSPYCASGIKARPRLAPLQDTTQHSAAASSSSALWVEGPDGRTVTPAALPSSLSWARPSSMWSLLLDKDRDVAYARQSHSLLFSRTLHPDLAQPRIRAILLDWMLDVCEVYKLHRETFYLATDFVDRYLSLTRGFARGQLQLLGITALFAAAKLEEIYPPKCEEFAYITDGACSDDNIRQFEVCLLQKLEWRLSPVTALQWLRIFLQLFHLGPDGTAPTTPASPAAAFPSSRGRTAGLSAAPACLLKPHFDRHTFLVCVKVLDVALVQEEAVGLSYAELAGGVLASLVAEGGVAGVAERTGLPAARLRSVVDFLAPTLAVLEDPGRLPPELRERHKPFPRTPHFEDVHPDDAHNIQTREATLALYDVISARKQETASWGRALGGGVPLEASPDASPIYPTPPPSSERPSTPPHLHDITNQ